MSTPQKPQKSSRGIWTIAIVFGGLFLLFLVFAVLLFNSVSQGRLGENQIGVIEIEGPITNADQILADLKHFNEQKEIQGILVRINSPGGAVAASQEIYEAVKNSEKKVVISLGNIAASGGFYIACAGPKVFANPGTITGSIGVISQTFEVDALMEYLNLKVNTVTSGVYKDSGSPFRDFTEKDRVHYEALVTDIYDQFLTAVAEARSMSKKDLAPYADGRVFTGKMAYEAKLVDELGGMQAAIDWLAEDLDMKGKPTLVYPRRDAEGLLKLLFDEGMSSMGDSIESAATPSFEYRYMGPGTR